MDTRPLAADPIVVLAEEAEAFQQGVQLIAKLAPKVFVCHQTGADIPQVKSRGISYHGFEGVHPAGLSGTHIHTLDPAGESKTVWSIDYQDVIALSLIHI